MSRCGANNLSQFISIILLLNNFVTISQADINKAIIFDELSSVIKLP